MEQPITTSYPVSDVMGWDYNEQLILAPRFQRNSVWPPKAKSYLIDTILRALPIPTIYLRLKVDVKNRKTIREVVDGQQRIRAVLDFMKDKFPVLKIHNPDYAGLYFSQLTEQAKEVFLGYKLSVSVLESISDSEVLAIFSRINTYNVKLSPQELINAQFYGAFKQTIYGIARENYIFWLNNRILADMSIARMGDAQLVSELVISMIDGIRKTKNQDLRDFYKRFDDDFPASQKIWKEFSDIIDLIGNLFNDRLKTSIFRRQPLFYSLFCALYDARFGLNNSKHEKIKFNSNIIAQISQKLEELDYLINTKNMPPSLSDFLSAARSATSDPGTRRTRHEFIWTEIFNTLKK